MTIKTQKLSLFFVLFSGLLFAGTVSAEPLALDGSPETQLILLLSHIHEDPTQAELESIDIELDEALAQIALDEQQITLARGRAIRAMQYAPSEVTRSAIATLMVQESAGDLFLLGRCVKLLQTDFADAQPTWTLEQLQPLVGHPDPAIREALVFALAHSRELPAVSQGADDALLQIALAERNPEVQEALELKLEGVQALQTSQGAIRRVAE